MLGRRLLLAVVADPRVAAFGAAASPRLVKDGKIGSVEDSYLHFLPIKEYQIIDQASSLAPWRMR